MSNKTIANNNSVEDFLNNIKDSAQKSDSKKLVEIFQKISGNKPVMWGASIIGFGHENLTYASGRKVEWLKIGFSPRKGKISLYVTFDAKELTSRFPDLGKYKTGVGCIYIKSLDEIDLAELKKLVKTAWNNEIVSPKRKDGKEKIV